MWHVEVDANYELAVWAADKDEAEEIATEEFFQHDEDIEMDISASPMKVGHYLSSSQPYGRKDDLTCEEILEAQEAK